MISKEIYEILSNNTIFDNSPFLKEIPSDFNVSYDRFVIMDSLSTFLEKSDANFMFISKEQDFTLHVLTKNSEDMDAFLYEIIDSIIDLNYSGYTVNISNIYEMPGEVFGGYTVKGINFTVNKIWLIL